MKTANIISAAIAATLISLTPALAQRPDRPASRPSYGQSYGRTDRNDRYDRNARYDRNSRNDRNDRYDRNNRYGRNDSYNRPPTRPGQPPVAPAPAPAPAPRPILSDFRMPALEVADYRYAHSCGDYAEHFYNHPVKSEPVSYKTFTAGGITYLISHDIYFRYIGENLCISRPPFGETFDRSFFIAEPRPCKMNPMYRTNQEYCYGDGVIFKYTRGSYTVVEPPVGLWIEELPDDAGTAIIDGIQYYVIDGTLFQNVPGTRRPTFEAVGRL